MAGRTFRKTREKRKKLASEAKVRFHWPPRRNQRPAVFCRVVQLVAHQILDLGVLGSSPSAAAFLIFRTGRD